MKRSRFSKVLVPHDFSRHADRALRLAADLLAPGGSLRLLHVVTPATQSVWYPAIDGGAWLVPEKVVGDEQRRLEARVKRVLGSRAGRATCRVVMGNPVEQIVADARRVDLVVMATAGLTGLAHMLIGSVAERVVRHAPVPVLIMPARATRPRRRPTRRGRAAGVLRRTKRAGSIRA